MKSSKSKTIILLILLVFIWGTIIYKVLKQTSDNRIYRIKKAEYKLDTCRNISKRDYKLFLNYDDPFLGKESKERKKKVETQKRNIPRLPYMIYKGCIYKASRSMGLLKYNNELLFVNKGQKISDIRILNIYKDSLKIKYLNKEFVLKKS